MCSCHFRNGEKKNVPEVFERNKEKLFPLEGPPPKRKKVSKVEASSSSKNEASHEPEELPSSTSEATLQRVETLILKNTLQTAEMNVENLEKVVKYHRHVYSVHKVNEKVIRMETGLPTKSVFNIVVQYVERFKDNILYHHGWTVEIARIKLEDQIFLTLMKLRQNYTNLHLAQLFGCSETTVSNIIMTFIHVLHKLFVEDIMAKICPSRFKNQVSAPVSFVHFSNCRMVIDCTDFEIAVPKQMDKQRATYSSYRSKNTFKALIGVSPNGVINYMSKLYAGSVSDKAIVQNCGILALFEPGDLILADKGFLIQDLVPPGVTVNIPPFLNNPQFSESEVKVTKELASCRIHVERANQRLKDFKILSFIPSMLRCHIDIVFHLVAALVNLQFLLIKETANF